MSAPEHAPILSWVIVDGEPRRVSDFAPLPPRRRPRASCPECGRALTLKLGRIRRHHAAHAPHDHCPATHPETALHIDCKFHIAEVLRRAAAGRQPVIVRHRCPSCAATHDDDWVHLWDEVVVEARLGDDRAARRPDVLLRRGGRAVAAIEVRVTHAVGDEKSAALAALSVPWIEVLAAARLVRGDDPWTIDRPIPADRSSHPWRCADHAAVTRLRAARVVDVYHATGLRDRVIYRLCETHDVAGGQLVALSLRGDGREIAAHAAPERDALARLRIAYAEDVARRAAQPGSFTDSPMRWARGQVADNLVDEALADTSRYDATPLGSRYPRRWFFARERGEWFLPPDMRHVRWDRVDPDAFAPHQASTASRAIVRERPVPEDAWRTVVFARRPNAAMFGGRVTASVELTAPTVTIITAAADGTPRAFVVLSDQTSDDIVRAVATRLDDAATEHLFLSHPRDWSASRADLAWAASGRDERGRGLVVLDGAGVYRASAFLAAFARGDARLAPRRVRERMAERVGRLRARI